MFWFNVLITTACGAFLSVALPSTGLWFLVFAITPLFVFVARSERLKEAFWYGFCFALSFFSLYLLWLPNSFSELFGSVFWVTYPPMLFILGCMWGFVTWLSRFLAGRGSLNLWLLPALWVLMEWARTQGIFAFPWGVLGYVWIDTPIVQLADVVGVYGLSLLALALVAILASPFVNKTPHHNTFGYRSNRFPWRPLLSILILLVVAISYGSLRLASNFEPTSLALLVQGNTDPLGRALGEENDLEVYTRLTSSVFESSPLAKEIDLVIWPEGAVLNSNLANPYRSEIVRERIQESSGNAIVVTGGSAYENNNVFNSAFSLAEGKVVDRYDKVYLVPFGEFFPFIEPLKSIYREIFRWFDLPLLSSRSTGKEINPLATPLGNIATYICYESVFPHVSRTMVKNGAELLINISNDSWFGKGSGAEQHFLMGSMRAIETRRYLLRVGNDGITSLVDPLGRVVTGLPRGEEGTLLVDFSLEDNLTFYVRYGSLLVISLLVYAVIIGVVGVFSRSFD